MWTMCWTALDGADKWDRFNSADEVADKLLEIIKEHGAESSCDFNGEVLIFSPAACSEVINPSEIDSYCSDEWIETNTLP